LTFLLSTLLSSPRRQISLLVLTVFVLYLPAVWGTIVSIDDLGIMKFYGSNTLTLLDVVLPGEGYYYRPLIALTYYLDYHFFGQHSKVLHLENVLLHVANTALLFRLASRLLSPKAAGAPFFAALIFAVHPVNSEPVSWIAGRTDPLACLFILASALFLVKGLQSGKARHTLCCVLLMSAGMLAKETALFFVPGSLLLVYAWPHIRPEASAEAANRQGRLLLVCYLCMGLAVAALGAYRIGQDHNVLAKLYSRSGSEVADALLLSLQILGFYLKKMLVPWPLNFAVISLSGWYAIPGVAGLALLLLAPKRNIHFVCLTIGVLFLLPAVFVGAFDLTWTVVAERYLYLPSAFFALALAGSAHLAVQRLPQVKRAFVPAASLILAVFVLTTAQRTLVWQSNLALFEDTVEKTPDFGMLRNELAVALAKEGRFVEAGRQLEIASTLEISQLVKGLVRRNRMLIGVQGKPPEEARRVLKSDGRPMPAEETELLLLLRNNDYALMWQVKDRKHMEIMASELLEINEILFSRTGNAHYLYSSGQLCISLGEEKKAASFFARSYQAARDGESYKLPAKKLAEKMAAEPL